MRFAITGDGVLAKTAIECCKAADHEILPVTNHDIEVLWICRDTPIAESGYPETADVVHLMQKDINKLTGRPVVLISSQIPVGTTKMMEERFPGHFFAHSPENIRVASAVQDFMHQSRIVVGVRNRSRDSVIEALLSPFTSHIIFTSPETAEMVKHALNCYLGMSIAFINEIARVCKHMGANVDDVSDALLCERRIAPNAPLKPGPPFGGGHLMRDILVMERVAKGYGIKIPIITHIRESNEG